MKTLPEHQESLWRVIVSPLVWAAHFLACYLTAAIWCAKVAGPAGTIAPVRLAIAGLTAAALVLIALNGLEGWRRHRFGVNEGPPHDQDTPEDRHRFLGYATLLLAGMSAVAVVFAGFVVVFLEDCR